MTLNPKRGEIWQVNLEPTIGQEIQKSRPVVVISSDLFSALRLLFMASDPENSGLPPLHYEQEEASILKANERFRLFLQVEESGCLERKVNGWHLLRLYVGDTLPGALVNAPRNRQPAPPLSQATRLWGTNKTVADRMSFVGRRRPIQLCLKALTPPSELVGVIIYGFGGYGKSSLAARLCDRLSDYISILWDLSEDPLNKRTFINQLDKKLKIEYPSSDVAEIIKNEQELSLFVRLCRLFSQLNEIPPYKKFLFIFDDFENALELHNQESQFRKDAVEVIEILKSLIEAIRENDSEHRIIITSRYDLPAFSQREYLDRQELNEMTGTDLEKKLSHLPAFKSDSKVNPKLQERALALADGNSRLLEWLNGILTDRTLNNEQIFKKLAALKEDQKELREKVLAQELSRQIQDELKEILSRGLIFEIPVPREALEEVCQGIENLDSNIDRAIGLGLLSVSPNGELLRVPRILSISPPNNQQLFSKQGAEILYQLWWNSAWTEEQAQEILRLALKGKVKEIVLEVGDKLTKQLKKNNRCIEAIEICNMILELWKNIQIYHNLAFAYEEIGNIDQADQYFKKALKGPWSLSQTPEIKAEKADLLLHRATFLANRYTGNLSETLRLLRQSLAIAEEIEDRYRQAWAKSQLGRYTGYRINNIGHLEERQNLFEESEKYLQESKDLFIEIGDRSGEGWSLHNLGMLESSRGENDSAAIDLFLKSLSIHQETGEFLRRASNLHELGKIYAKLNQSENARKHFEEALKIREEWGGIGSTTAYQWAKLEEKLGNVLRSFELTLKALDLNLRLQHKDQDNNRKLIKDLFKVWKERDFYNTENGCDKSAKDLMEKLLELSVNSKYQYGYGQAIALWGLGKITVDQEGDTDKALNYLYQSLRILEKKDSDDAAEVQECINRLAG